MAKIKEEMKVGPKGQVVIPKPFRKAIGIGPGSKVVFELLDEKILLSKTEVDIVKIAEQIAKSGKTVHLKSHESEEEIEERHRERYE